MTGLRDSARSLALAAALAERLATALLARETPAPVALAGVVALIVEKTSISTQIARLILEAALTRLQPRTASLRPTTIPVASQPQLAQHGSPSASCWFCSATSWWRAPGPSSRWLCARCWEPRPEDIVWHEASAADLEDAAREPRWTATPDQDDYLLLRLRQVARDAARSAADLLGAWRRSTPRTSADLRVLDRNAITDGATIIASAEELRAWSIENAPAARAIARRALGEILGWPAVAVPPVLDRALELLAAPSEDAITALGRRWPQGHEPGSATPIPLRIDEATEVLLPAHPFLLLLLLGARPRQRERATASAKAEAHRTASRSLAELTSAAHIESKPPAKCHSCRGQRFFRIDQPWSTWTCATCHPPATATERFLWHPCDATAP